MNEVFFSNFVIWQVLLAVIMSARLAQSVEHETLNLGVVGSSPTLGDVVLIETNKLSVKTPRTAL